MKNIEVYTPPKYCTAKYQEVVPNIYQSGNYYVTSISFQQEPDLDEGSSAADISQYPLEDILERYCVHVSDFYPSLNTPKSVACYIELAGSKVENIKSLLSLVGRRVYNKAIYENGEECVVLIVE